MRKKGSYFELKNEMERDLIRAYREKLAEMLGNSSMDEIFHAVALSGASRFWVSEERAVAVISAMRKNAAAEKNNEPKHLFTGKYLQRISPTKRRMYAEIYNRVEDWQKDKPADTLQRAIAKIIQQPAPSFYLTEGSVKRMVYKIKRRWYEERKKKLRYMM